MDLGLDLNKGSPNVNDLRIANNDLVLVDSTEAIKQDVLQRLRFFRGEWFLDNTIGIPYYQQILVKNPSQEKIDALFIATILGTPGIIQLNQYAFRSVAQTRELFVTFSAQSTQGTVNYSGLI